MRNNPVRKARKEPKPQPIKREVTYSFDLSLKEGGKWVTKKIVLSEKQALNLRDKLDEALRDVDSI